MTSLSFNNWTVILAAYNIMCALFWFMQLIYIYTCKLYVYRHVTVICFPKMIFSTNTRIPTRFSLPNTNTRKHIYYFPKQQFSTNANDSEFRNEIVITIALCQMRDSLLVFWERKNYSLNVLKFKLLDWIVFLRLLNKNFRAYKSVFKYFITIHNEYYGSVWS